MLRHIVARRPFPPPPVAAGDRHSDIGQARLVEHISHRRPHPGDIDHQRTLLDDLWTVKDRLRLRDNPWVRGSQSPPLNMTNFIPIQEGFHLSILPHLMHERLEQNRRRRILQFAKIDTQVVRAHRKSSCHGRSSSSVTPPRSGNNGGTLLKNAASIISLLNSWPSASTNRHWYS